MIVIEDRSIEHVANEMIAGQSLWRPLLNFGTRSNRLRERALDELFDVKCFMSVMSATPMSLK